MSSNYCKRNSAVEKGLNSMLKDDIGYDRWFGGPLVRNLDIRFATFCCESESLLDR